MVTPVRRREMRLRPPPAAAVNPGGNAAHVLRAGPINDDHRSVARCRLDLFPELHCSHPKCTPVTMPAIISAVTVSMNLRNHDHGNGPLRAPLMVMTDRPLSSQVLVVDR